MRWNRKMETALEGAQEWGEGLRKSPPFPSFFYFPTAWPPEARDKMGQGTGTSQLGMSALKQRDFRISSHKIKRVYNQDLSFLTGMDPRDSLKV